MPLAPHEFHHPDRGILPNLALEGGYETQHHKTRQGYATCSFTLVQNGPPIPQIFEELGGRIRGAAAAVLTGSAATFDASWSGRDPFGLAASALARVSSTLMSAYTKVSAGLGPITELRREIKAFHRNVDSLKSLRGAFAGAFQVLARVFMNNLSKRLRELERGSSPAREIMGVVEELRSFALGPEALAEHASLVSAGNVNELTPKALAAKLDLDALAVLVNATVLAAVAESLKELELPTANAAVELGQALAVVFDDLLGAELGAVPIGSELHDAVLELRVQVLEYLSEAGGTLPIVRTLELAAGVEVSLALVAYWRAGAGPGFFTELEHLLDANPELADPFEVPPGAELKVVTL